MIQFYLNDELVSLTQAQADLTVLQYLREQRKLTGSKEGCAAGDCGACTVAVVQLSDDQQDLEYRALNSCVTFMAALAGKQLISVEHIGQSKDAHPVQQAMVDHHGSQCGFCTPGIVMSLFALYHTADQVNRNDVLTALSGNLCRCTGYRPIIDAAMDACNQPRQDKFIEAKAEMIARLKSLRTDGLSGDDKLCIPKTRQQLRDAIARMPDARLVAGSTDLALEVTQQLKTLPQMISLTQVAELNRISDDSDSLVIGAACSLRDIQKPLLLHFPDLHELIDRFASLPIRNQATLGGNVANASPIGDMPPVLLALDAQVAIDDGDQITRLPIRDFFLGYRQTALAQGQWLDSIVIPLPQQSTPQLRAYKVSKRMEDDISAVCAVFNIELHDGKVVKLSTGFGGVAATPVQCEQLEAAMIGKAWSDAQCVELGKTILSQAFSPIDDVRASAAYRNQLLGNLWHRFWLETNHQNNPVETRVVAHA